MNKKLFEYNNNFITFFIIDVVHLSNIWFYINDVLIFVDVSIGSVKVVEK